MNLPLLAQQEQDEQKRTHSALQVRAGQEEACADLGHRAAGSASFVLSTYTRAETHAIEEAVASVDRLSRLASDLANERTLLAWVRTGLAAIRTCFTYLGVAAISAGMDWTVYATAIAMTTVVLFAAFTGALRYRSVRLALMTPGAPPAFHRGSLQYFYGFVVVAALATAMGMYTQAWGKKH